jgi:hypothetical protein
LENQIGADLWVYDISRATFIDEVHISQFLNEQREIDGAVIDWTFNSPDLAQLMNQIKPGRGLETEIQDLAGYKSFEAAIFAVQKNFLKVTNRRYYMLDEMDQEMLDADENGEISKFPEG